MNNTLLKLDIDNSFEQWNELVINSNTNDSIIFSKNADSIRWFVTNFMQHLINSGNHEVWPIYGKLAKTLSSFCYQINLCAPIGYKFRSDYGMLYEIMLNFETEPFRRILIWSDAQYLLNSNKDTFKQIFETVIVAGYLNRNGISTFKEDNTRYKVDQRNIFIFQDTQIEELTSIINKEYYLPSIDLIYPHDIHKQFEFNLFELSDPPSTDED